MEISVDNPQFFYQLMYALTFAFIFSVVIYRSIKLGYPLRTILLMLATITLFIIIGTRLITIPLDQWISAIGSENASHTNRSSIGGIVFGLAGLLISLKLFKHKRPILKLFAWVVPLGLAIAKLGCLFNGCCYGLAFNGFWSIQYPVTTNAHYNHWHSGAIANDAMQSLAVHPVQLYESLILVIIGIVVWKTHNIWKRSLSAVLFALFLYFTLRFGVEFFRDHSVSQFGNQHYLGVWLYQWVMLGIGILMGVWLWLNESIVFKHSIKSQRTLSFNHIELTFVASLTVLIYLFQNLLKPFELLVVWSIFIPAVTLFLYAIFRENNVFNHRKIVIASLFAPFFVMAQTMPDQKYHRIDVGGSFGNFANEVKFNAQSNDCGGTSYSSEYFRQVYQIAGAGYSQVVKRNNKTTTYGAFISGGNIESTNLRTNESKSEFMFAINPYIKWDSKWIGLGGGVQLGNLRRNSETTIETEDFDDVNKKYAILPEFHLRVFPRKYVSLEYNYGFLMPTAYPTLYSRASIGTSFGLSEDYSLRYGHITNLDTGYIAAEALITENIGVNLMYVFKEDDLSGIENTDLSGKFIFSLNYRFGHRN